MTSTGVLRPAPGGVPPIGSDLQAARTFEQTGSALARSVAAAASTPAAPQPVVVTRAVPATPGDDLAAELRGSLLLLAAILLPALVVALLWL